MSKQERQDERGSCRARCTNCMEALWEPSREEHIWVVKDAATFSWENVRVRRRGGLGQENNVRVHGEIMKANIKVPKEAKLHLLECIGLQLEKIDDERWHND
jgi:hypothetical protein